MSDEFKCMGDMLLCRKRSDPKRTTQSVLDMERATPDSSYGNTNTAAMVTTVLLCSYGMCLHIVYVYMI